MGILMQKSLHLLFILLLPLCFLMQKNSQIGLFSKKNMLSIDNTQDRKIGEKLNPFHGCFTIKRIKFMLAKQISIV